MRLIDREGNLRSLRETKRCRCELGSSPLPCCLSTSEGTVSPGLSPRGNRGVENNTRARIIIALYYRSRKMEKLNFQNYFQRLRHRFTNELRDLLTFLVAARDKRALGHRPFLAVTAL